MIMSVSAATWGSKESATESEDVIWTMKKFRYSVTLEKVATFGDDS
jgi:hypothetical protein